MAILKVSRMGHPVLRQPAEEIAPGGLKSDELKALADDMVETMVEYAGVGLAAPQVHYGVRLFVIQPDPGDETSLRIAANPVVTLLTEETVEAWEGCLSVPDIHGLVSRFLKVRLDAFDRDGKKYSVELEDFAARVAQHEADHMDGVLFLDRMTNLSNLAFGEEFRRYHAPRPEPEQEEGEETSDES
ncbi:MAG: peptide deformylase [Nitrospinaceae bacterium]|jgi:peptide deformylase|nr:peptide deformylase [Nitrospinaceae bacterium]MBT3432981.1 peptide deformylase [Nitrospinaceae bacterium]MBT3819766.1 peptide deformylase [Nitrospinaceae bacterium]MBT4092542.1 peptide deformylase [Nitrospinaceae bacterium]MBT4432672.1 peptide deformylase [Nitrospinaceae bacterium]